MAGHTAYNISKMGMTMVAMGVAEENLGDNITGNSLWPATVIESLASINFKLGELFYLLFWGGLLFFFFVRFPQSHPIRLCALSTCACHTNRSPSWSSTWQLPPLPTRPTRIGKCMCRRAARHACTFVLAAATAAAALSRSLSIFLTVARHHTHAHAHTHLPTHRGPFTVA